MKSVYDAAVRDELITRIRQLTENNQARWGKMTVFQMLKHCTLWEEMVLNGKKYKRVFVGRLFGRMALNSMVRDDRPLRRNSPSIPELIITGSGSVALQQEQWVAQIEEHGKRFNPDFVHPFFGKMTKEETGLLAYKHADHHLQQFGG
ncbi:MAG TPA: DinB family protein [Puia sp.]